MYGIEGEGGGYGCLDTHCGVCMQESSHLLQAGLNTSPMKFMLTQLSTKLELKLKLSLAISLGNLALTVSLSQCFYVCMCVFL